LIAAIKIMYIMMMTSKIEKGMRTRKSGNAENIMDMREKENRAQEN